MIHGKVSIYIEEDGSNYSFGAELKFNAKAGEKYTISSNQSIVNKRIIDIEFIVLNRGKIVLMSKSEKIKRPIPVYVPIFL